MPRRDKKTGAASLPVDVWRDDRFAQRRLSIAALLGRAGRKSANRRKLRHGAQGGHAEGGRDSAIKDGEPL